MKSDNTSQADVSGGFYIAAADVLSLEGVTVEDALFGPFNSDEEFNGWCHRYVHKVKPDDGSAA